MNILMSIVSFICAIQLRSRQAHIFYYFVSNLRFCYRRSHHCDIFRACPMNRLGQPKWRKGSSTRLLMQATCYTRILSIHRANCPLPEPLSAYSFFIHVSNKISINSGQEGLPLRLQNIPNLNECFFWRVLKTT
jgi:hypothetical protein